MDVLLLLSNTAYYVVYYDDEVDKVNQYQQLSLVDLGKIQIGPEPTLWLAKIVLHEMALKIYRSKWLLSHTESCNAQSRRGWKRYPSKLPVFPTKGEKLCLLMKRDRYTSTPSSCPLQSNLQAQESV